MATENKKTTSKNQQAEPQETLSPAEKKQEIINDLTEKSKALKAKLTYSVIADVLEATDLDKNAMDDIYDALMTRGIEIISETENDFDEDLLLKGLMVIYNKNNI